MELQRKCKVEMLEGKEDDKTGGLVLNTPNNLLYTVKDYKECSNYRTIKVTDSSFEEWDKVMIPQHLYILDEQAEIKEGDWVYDSIGGQILQFNNRTAVAKANSQKEDYREKTYFKIIATTDISLKLPRGHIEVVAIYEGETFKGDDIPLPQPSPQFINKYVEAYNKGEKIEYCMVEMEYLEGEFLTELEGCPYSPVINRIKVDKHNHITITAIKDSWSREEVRDIVIQALGEGMLVHQLDDYKDIDYDAVNEWIKQNL